ncbi:hypothetical protein AOLI_G00314660 [Acnodon oligacanthus]
MKTIVCSFALKPWRILGFRTLRPRYETVRTEVDGFDQDSKEDDAADNERCILVTQHDFSVGDTEHYEENEEKEEDQGESHQNHHLLAGCSWSVFTAS